jgi:phosphohistidine phosphatase SixA
MSTTRRLVPIALALLVTFGCGPAPKPPETASTTAIAPEPTPATEAGGGAGGPVIVYVVRHAEKAVSADALKDPPLTEQGARRAAALATAIDAEALVAVYATPYVRTRSTAAPCAEAAGLAVAEHPADDTAGLVAKIRAAGRGSVLVVGHSNTVPEILKALGVAETVALGDGDFGDLFVVTLAPGGAAAMERRRFGD